MTTTHAKSIAARIKRVANERGATYGEVLTEFLIERAAVRLVSIPFIYKHLIFQGRICWFTGLWVAAIYDGLGCGHSPGQSK